MIKHLLFISFCCIYVGYSTLVRGRPKGGIIGAPSGNPNDNDTKTDEKYIYRDTIKQTVDHFGSGPQDIWLQRYQYNMKFGMNSNSNLAFLMLGGEGELSDKWIKDENVSMMTWAKEFGAHAFQVEHRFYGPRGFSPVDDQSVGSLQLLTIDQALADFKNFIEQMNSKYFSGRNMRWITFGGSYPGSLSAFFRETYPEMTIGAVSSSSAVHVFVDYFGYAVNTEANYRRYNQQCANNIGAAFQKMIKLAYSGSYGRSQLVSQFNLCQSFDETKITKSVQYFFQNVYGIFQGINQYSGDNKPPANQGLGIPSACAKMTDISEPDVVQRVKNVWDQYNYYYGIEGCNDNSYDGFITKYGDPTYPADADVVGTRSWLWQTCTELGYFQTTDGGHNSIFGSTVPLDFFADQCTDLFNSTYTLDTTYRLVAKVKNQYGAPDNYRGTRVVFPNGSNDPWKWLGLTPEYKNDANDIDAFTIDGTAHCADMYPPSPNDGQSLIDGRQRIHDHLQRWITSSSSSLSTLISLCFFLIYLF